MRKKEQDQLDLKSLNDIGARIKWCRVSLKLTRKEVSESVGMSQGLLCDRENNMRARSPEEYWLLVKYFNSKWKDLKEFPSHNGTVIKKISLVWFLYGMFNE